MDTIGGDKPPTERKENKMKRALVFEARREGYGIDQIEMAITVGELKRMVEELDDDMMVILSHDGGYTYGGMPSYAEIREEREGEYGDEYVTVDEIWA